MYTTPNLAQKVSTVGLVLWTMVFILRTWLASIDNLSSPTFYSIGTKEPSQTVDGVVGYKFQANRAGKWPWLALGQAPEKLNAAEHGACEGVLRLDWIDV